MVTRGVLLSVEGSGRLTSRIPGSALLVGRDGCASDCERCTFEGVLGGEGARVLDDDGAGKIGDIVRAFTGELFRVLDEDEASNVGSTVGIFVSGFTRAFG